MGVDFQGHGRLDWVGLDWIGGRIVVCFFVSRRELIDVWCGRCRAVLYFGGTNCLIGKGEGGG